MAMVHAFFKPMFLAYIVFSSSKLYLRDSDGANPPSCASSQSVLSSVSVKKVKASSQLWNNANPFHRTICTVCSSFPQQLDGGGGDAGYRQTDRSSRWLTHSSLAINLWLSLQLFLTCTRWPNHWATPKTIWLGNSHRWQPVPGVPPEQHTNTGDSQTQTNTHFLVCTSYTQHWYMHT